MAGQIIRRGQEKWLVRVSLGRAADGKRLYHNRTVHGKRKDAQQYLTRVLRELDTQTFVGRSKQSVAEFLEAWLRDTACHRLRRRTFDDYSALLSRHVLPRFGNRRLSDLSPQEIASMHGSMIADGLSARTVRYVHAVLQTALNDAVRWRILSQNPALLVRPPKAQRQEMRSLTHEQANAFIEGARDDRWFALWVLLISTGLRPGEALGLKWSDIEEGRIRVQRSLTRRSDGSWELTEPKTPKARRVVTAPNSLRDVLEHHRRQQLEQRLRAGADWTDHNLVFCTHQGMPLDYRVVVRRHFKPLVRALGLPSFRPYDLRHTCATLLLSAGENVKVVSERLGHSTATLTLDVYSHVLPTLQEQASERLESILFSKPRLAI